MLPFFLMLLGCSCTEPRTEAPSATRVLLSEAWAVARPAVAPLRPGPGWSALIGEHDYRAAVSAFGGDGGLASARAHADAAGMYRQAARLVAIAILADGVPQEEESVAHLLLGDREAARSVGGSSAWAKFVQDDRPWPPSLGEVGPTLPPLTAGSWPQLPVRGPHPGDLMALALWHEATAMQTAGPLASSVATYGGRYRLPVEPPAPQASLPIEFLVASDFLGTWDAAFMNDAYQTGPDDAAGRWSERSLVAIIWRTLSPSPTEEAVLAEVDRLHGVVLVESADWLCTGKYGRVCADMTRVALLQNLSLLAEWSGQSALARGARNAAQERDREDPGWLANTSASELALGNPLRGLELIPDLTRRYGSLRPCLDAMKLHEPQ